MNHKIKRAAAPLLCLLLSLLLLGGHGAPRPQETVAAGVFSVDGKADGQIMLTPGGMPFGVKFFTEGVLVVGFCDIQTEGGSQNPAYSAGLRLKDIITAVDGVKLNGATQLTDAVENSGGKPIKLTYMRDEQQHTVTLNPVFCESEGRYKTGIWVRDSGAGIGTVTFIKRESGEFGGLGHGICDSDTGELIPMQRGSVTSVTISGIGKGIAGDPGEIKGYFGSGKCGTLISNTNNGVYGIFSELPSDASEEALPIATRSEIHEGDAIIRCTLDNNHIREYSVSLSSIDRNARDNKCFCVTVTDDELIELTGGIIQGMSGSPIIQDGKLVGAVTHVLINDPTRGYGIFIENMLDSTPEILR